MSLSKRSAFFIALVLGIIIGNTVTVYYKNKEAVTQENARADVVSLLYTERTKRIQDSIEYNQIINQASDAYYKLLQKNKK